MKKFLLGGILLSGMLFLACQAQQKTEEAKQEIQAEIAPVKKEKPQSDTNAAANGKIVKAIANDKITLEDGTSIVLSKGTTIFLIRHAEKLKEGENPALSKAGKDRAERLLNIFKAHELDRVYTTFYQRTIQTIEPLTKMMGKFYNAYQPNDLKTFGETVLKKDQGKQILIVGHSNTTPALVNILSGQENKYPQIPEEEYGHFYIVHLDEAGKTEVLKLQY